MSQETIAYLEKRIKQGEEYFGLAIGEITVIIYRDLTATQQLILALVRKDIRSTGLMVEHMNLGIENILLNIKVLKGKGYLKIYKKLYFPIEFPDSDLKQASITYWHEVHPVNRDTHNMRLARVESYRQKEINLLENRKKEIEEVEEVETTVPEETRTFSPPKQNWNH